jgi:hypothetical protein
MKVSSHALQSPAAPVPESDATPADGSGAARPRLVPRRDATVVRILDENRACRDVVLGDRLRKIGL